MKRPTNPEAFALVVAWGIALVAVSPWLLPLLPVLTILQGRAMIRHEERRR